MPRLKPETLTARKEHILQAALVCFVGNGFHKTTMDDIVREASLSKGSIYTYFKSKKELFQGLLEKIFMDTGLYPILSEEGRGGREKLDAALASMISFTMSSTYQYYAAVLMEAWTLAQIDPDIKQKLGEMYSYLRQLFSSSIEQSISLGEFKPVNATALANIFLAIFDGLLVQSRLDGTAIEWEAIAHTIQYSWMPGLLSKE